MDIYFCDLCGVRVTDADLHAGHGMRDVFDVICSGCLELGHHKEWLNRRAKSKPVLATAGKPSAPAFGEKGDRIATLEEGVPPSKVEPKVIAAEPTPSGPNLVLPEDHTSTTKVPAPDQPSEMPLAGAASLFSALGSPNHHANGSLKTDSRPGEDDDDDLLDQADQPQVTTTPEPAESPFANNVTDNSEKAETALIAAKGSLGKAATEEVPAIQDDEIKEKADKGKGTAKADPRKSTSSRHSKPSTGKGKSSRSARANGGKDAGRMILMGSYISMALILLIFGGIYLKKKGYIGPKKAVASVGIDGDEIKDMVQSTMSMTVAAIRSEDLAQLEAAKAAMERTQTAVDRFEETAKHSGNTDEQINNFLERIAKWNDCYAMKRNLNDLILRLKSH